MELRLATLDDAEAIRRIYNLEVETSTATMDLVVRSLEDQRAWLAARSGAFGVVVAIGHGEVIGFASLSPYKERAAYRSTVEDSVYVDRAHHGRGVGKLLLQEVLDVALASGFHSMMARVEATRAASIALHTSLGFELVGVEREVGRKFNRWLDVALMQRMLHASAPPTLPRH